MISVVTNTAEIQKTQYILSILSSCLGVTIGGVANGRRMPVLLSYGTVSAKPEAGQVVIHFPEDTDRWHSKAAPQDVPATHYVWTGENTICISNDCIYSMYYYLTLGEEARLHPDRHGRLSPFNSSSTDDPNYAEPLLNTVLSVIRQAIRDALRSLQLPFINIAMWPEAKPFAAFLSHDVDRIYDREFFKVLSDLNRLGRLARKRMAGDVRDGLSRAVRDLWSPKDPIEAFHHLLGIEAKHSFRSTFFMLEDRYWARHGSAYRFTDKAVGEIARLIISNGGELGIHGGYYMFNSATAYASTRISLKNSLGFEPQGIRNHYMRFSYPATWQAHTEAGFTYDSTLGYYDAPGYRGRLSFPFSVFDSTNDSVLPLTELPLTVMDGTLFDYQQLNAEQAFGLVERAVTDAEQAGGLVTLLWHNNYFNEPEFSAWEEVYRQSLILLAKREAYVAPGQEIVSWWRDRNMVRLLTDDYSSEFWRGHLECQTELKALTVDVDLSEVRCKVEVSGANHELSEIGSKVRIVFPQLHSGSNAFIHVENHPR